MRMYLIKLFTLVFFGCISFDLFSFPFPVVTSFRVDNLNTDPMTYHVTWATVEVPDEDDVLVPLIRGTLTFNYIYPHSDIHSPHEAPYYTFNDGKQRTLSELAALFIEKNGRNGSFSASVAREPSTSQIKKYCMSITNSTGAGQPASSIARYLPVSIVGLCDSNASWLNVYCDIKTTSVSFDYGEITVKEVESAVKEASLNVFCPSGASVLLSLANGVGYIPLSNGMISVINIEGQPIGKTIKLNDGTNDLKITSTLEGSPLVMGDFSGSTYLIINYP